MVDDCRDHERVEINNVDYKYKLKNRSDFQELLGYRDQVLEY